MDINQLINEKIVEIIQYMTNEIVYSDIVMFPEKCIKKSDVMQILEGAVQQTLDRFDLDKTAMIYEDDQITIY